MNYLKEILAFNDYLLLNKLSTGQINLWYALMYINNKSSWAEWFTVPNHVLENLTGLTRQAINKNRNILAQKGFLAFRQNGTKATAYKLMSIANSLQDSLQGSLQGSLQDSLQGSCQNSCTLNKQNKTKTKTIKESVKRKIFTPPSLDEVKEYCRERGNGIDAERFIDFYTAKGWRIGANPMKDWRAAVRTWEQREREKANAFNSYSEMSDYDLEEVEMQALERRMSDEGIIHSTG